MVSPLSPSDDILFTNPIHNISATYIRLFHQIWILILVNLRDSPVLLLSLPHGHTLKKILERKVPVTKINTLSGQLTAQGVSLLPR